MHKTKRRKPIRPLAPAQAPSRNASPALAVLEAPQEPEAMPRVEEWIQTPCPYCGEELEVLVRSDEEGRTRYEECSVCCRNVALHVTWDDGELQAEADRA